TALSMFTSSFALLLACAGFFAFDLVTFRTNMVNNLSAQAAIIGYNSASALLFHDEPSAMKTLSALGARRAISSAVIYGRDGHTFAAWKPDGLIGAPTDLPAFAAKHEVHYF